LVCLSCLYSQTYPSPNSGAAKTIIIKAKVIIIRGRGIVQFIKGIQIVITIITDIMDINLDLIMALNIPIIGIMVIGTHGVIGTTIVRDTQNTIDMAII
jgi:hypothetical protein